MKFASRVTKLEPSITLAVTARANAMKAKGEDVVAFGAGEPDFDTPAHIQEAAIKAMRDGLTRYTPALGLPALRAAVAEKYSAFYHYPTTPKNVAISCGGKHSLYNVFHALVERGDEVLIPAPYWVSYPEMVKLAGGVPVIVETDEDTGFRVTVDRLRAYTTDRTKILLINSPSNPTGAAYHRKELEAIAEFVLENDLVLISDEIYEHLVFDDFEFVCFPTLAEELRERTVVVSGASKTYAMTGWRIGWTVAPEGLIEMMGRLQDQSTSNATSFAQAGAIAALKGPQDCVKTMCAAFAERRAYMMRRLAELPNVACCVPQGAFYVFPKVSACYGRQAGGRAVDGSVALSEYLLEKVKVAVVPGIGFGADANIRLSYATSMQQIEKGLDRIAEALGAL
jgi:aspartate aminotransferase